MNLVQHYLYHTYFNTTEVGVLNWILKLFIYERTREAQIDGHKIHFWADDIELQRVLEFGDLLWMRICCMQG